MKTMKVLVVDDDEITLSVLENTLTEAGYEVTQASTGGEGLEKFKSNNFDLIITDLKMPNMNGIELVRKARILNPNIKIIVITAFEDIDSYLLARNFGAFKYLNKPVKPDELLEVLRMYLK